jgi:betaine-homocysteine S-methyltransferase
MARSSRTLRQRLAEGTVVGAEGYVFELERRGYIKAGPYVPEVVLDAPEAVLQLHREFLRAGADVMVALTYYAHREKLRVVGREGDLEAMNRAAVQLANQVAAEGDALVAANICNTWSYDPREPERTGAIVRAQYEEQLGWALDEGVDFVIHETNDYLGEALIGLQVCQDLGLPAMVTFASVQPTHTYDGFAYVEACRRVAEAGATVVGLNCSRGPTTMRPLLEEIRAGVSCAVAAQPVPFHTTAQTPAFEALQTRSGERAFPLQLEPYACSRFELADFARWANAAGIDYIGICCGGGPHHVRAIAEALGRQAPASRYSPALELHPVLGSVAAGDAPEHGEMGDWTTT